MSELLQEQSDDSLISATLAGDDGAFAHIVTRYKRRVFSLAIRFTQDRDELDDICQEVFIKAYDNLHKFRREAPFEHWITKIATRVCYDALRSQRHVNNQVIGEQTLEVQDHAADARNNAREARELLAWALAQLKPDERLVITLMELEEKSIKETVDLTGWSESNVKVRAHRARQALKRILEVDHGR